LDRCHFTAYISVATTASADPPPQHVWCHSAARSPIEGVPLGTLPSVYVSPARVSSATSASTRGHLRRRETVPRGSMQAFPALPTESRQPACCRARPLSCGIYIQNNQHPGRVFVEDTAGGGRESCVLCAPGKYTDILAASTCTACAPGSFQVSGQARPS
jgi:hypothetical protein